MPKIRIGFATDINLVNEQVGIGTTNPTARLDVRGDIRADNSAGSGVISTLTRYDGFLNKTQSLPHNVSIAQTTKGNLNSLSGEIVIDGEITVTEGTSLTGGRLDSLTVTGTFDLPHGGTEDREETPEKGSTRFNQDLGQLEFYTGLEWRTVGSYDGSGRGRGVFGGGYTPTVISNIEFFNISTLGNSVNFGNLTEIKRSLSACSSSIRGVFGGGVIPTATNTIEYITIASQGNGIDFGDLTLARRDLSALSSSTRGVFGGGLTPTYVNNIDYVQISTIGNTLDFGDLTQTAAFLSASSSSTRGLFFGGYIAPAFISSIDYITISSVGNAVRFGDLVSQRANTGSCSNGVRVVIGGGSITGSPSSSNTIDYVTISSTGNAAYFGDLTVTRSTLKATSNNIRGVFGGGYNSFSPAGSVVRYNTIDYVTISTTGNALDFGDLTNPISRSAALSDSHGGLGGF